MLLLLLLLLPHRTPAPASPLIFPNQGGSTLFVYHAST
jgi:hypothetical protein